MFATEVEFTLPCGYLDTAGQLHRQGAMRLATALDEIAPLQDSRVKLNEAYLTIILLSQVVTRLGTLRQITTSVIEGLFAADLAYLEALYRHLNEELEPAVEQVICPKCYHQFERKVSEI